jgi:predicted DCC family thiol-disulfide oxidoreductase YuxK
MFDPFSFRQDRQVSQLTDHALFAVMGAEGAICSRGVRMIHRLDRRGPMPVCTIHAPLWNDLLRRYAFQPTDPSNWLYFDHRVARPYVEAVVHTARRFGGWGRLGTVLLTLPQAMREWRCRHLARNAYAIPEGADGWAIPDRAFQGCLLR